MKYIWAPWRMAYILSEKKEGCLFCEKWRADKDEENYILYRGKENFILLNLYPYNPGHLMVAPYNHKSLLDELNVEEFKEHFELVAYGIAKLREACQPDGFNAGLNLGKVAGAGVEEHLHTHIVPRWDGDTSLMPVIAESKVIPEALDATYARLKEKFSKG